MQNLSGIIGNFKITGTLAETMPLGAGLINDTYKVKTKEENAPDYVLQRINHNIFRDVEGLQNNINAVTRHIRLKLEESGEKDISLIVFISL